jgi:hypothetical protein
MWGISFTKDYKVLITIAPPEKSTARKHKALLPGFPVPICLNGAGYPGLNLCLKCGGIHINYGGCHF